MSKPEGNFDPIRRHDADISEEHLSRIRLNQRVPTFLDLHGQRQTVTSWRAELRFTIGIAHRVLHSNSSIGELIGVPVRAGVQGSGWMHMPHLDLSIPYLSQQGCGEAVRRIVLDMQLPCRMRLEVDQGLGGSYLPIVAFHSPRPEDVPKFGSFVPQRRGAAPAFDRGRTLVTEADMETDLRNRLTSGEVVVGSWVSLSIPGVVNPDRAFRIVEGAGNPAQAMLGITSPVGAAVLGLKGGDEASYQVGPALRKISVMEVDNGPLMSKLGIKVPAPAKERDLAMSF